MTTNEHYNIENTLKRFKASQHYQDFIQDSAIYNIVAFVRDDSCSTNAILLDSVVRKRVDALIVELSI